MHIHTRIPLFFRRYWVWIIVVGVGITVTAVATLVYARFSTLFVANPPQEISTEVVTSSTPPPDPLRPYSVLLLGYGGPGHAGGSLTDTLLLAYIKPREHSVTLVSIPRDVWVKVPIAPDRFELAKINAAFAIGNDDQKYPHKPEQFRGKGGGGRLASEVVGEILGIEVDFFVAVDFSGFVHVLDALGPLEVRVPVSFTDEFYPLAGKENETCDKSPEEIEALTATMSGYVLEQQFPCRFERLEFKAGSQTMDAATALKFVRSRHSLQHGGDFGRSERQQALLAAVMQKVTSPLTFVKLLPTALNIFKYIQTNSTPEKITEIITTHGHLDTYSLRVIRLTEENALTHAYSADRQYILIPKSGDGNWQSVRDFFAKEVLEASASASAN